MWAVSVVEWAESRWRGGYVPAELNSFVGRRELLATAKAKLADPQVRLLSLTGGGGTGKTRLAMRLANEARRAYPDGVWWVDLASLVDPPSVGRVIVGALPIDDVSTREFGDVLITALAERALLLVLDNCEHLIEALVPLVVRLLRACPELRIVATSRLPLRCEGEHLLDVPPLSVPADPQAVTTEYEAVRLFEARAGAARADFVITAENAADVARLARMLDGIPLAIELAAPLVRVMSLPDIVSLLSTFRLRALAKEVGTPAHHRTLWDSFEWSYQLCSEAEQLLWTRLAVFAGSFTVDAAVAVASDGTLDAAQVPMILRELVGKNILVADTDSIPTRYAMLSTVREYGQARLSSREEHEPASPPDRPAPETGDESAAYRRLRTHFLHRAGHLSRRWYGPDETRYLWEAAQDLPNYRAVLDRCAAATTLEEAEDGARIAVALTTLRLWFFGGSLGEGLRALLRADEALARNNAEDPLRLTVLAKAGWIALCLGDQANAENLLDRCRSLTSRVTGGGEADAALAGYAFFTGAADLFLRGDPATPELFAKARDDLAAADDPGTVPMAEMFHAIAAAFIAPETDAVAVTDRHLADTNAHGAPWAITWAQWARAVTELRHGDPQTAVVMLRSALRAQWDMGDRWGSTWCVESLAWAAGARGHFEEAALLLGAAQNMQQTLGVTISRLRPWARAHAACADQARAALGEAYDVTEGYGMEMDVDAVVDLALGQPSAPRADAPSPPRAVKSPLSEKQQAVAELIAEGRTDKQIASALFLSPRTVQSHVSAILRRLGFNSRTEIAKWIVERQRVPSDGAVPSPSRRGLPARSDRGLP
ncbi:LuxR C-terminal-related transcriptional regulator [Actinoallomurus purpureus]|uniref:ATP-binding protein n=1 Tax=Actinoallomurus purpureus TaxID=478114 RepID=UPI002093CD05|nr:LuxR C-terminal-related transcriptional regulator [Actinoallomurus purpureus]MCO6007088.1 LuxR C-terminal-related transcriptional regulator [Actinoallomurus purpureus]